MLKKAATYEGEDYDPINISEPQDELRFEEDLAQPISKIMPAQPLLPKTWVKEVKPPPMCPLRNINFIKLAKFNLPEKRLVQMMGEGFDQLGKRNMMRENK
jgi:hypothetical protein